MSLQIASHDGTMSKDLNKPLISSPPDSDDIDAQLCSSIDQLRECTVILEGFQQKPGTNNNENSLTKIQMKETISAGNRNIMSITHLLQQLDTLNLRKKKDGGFQDEASRKARISFEQYKERYMAALRVVHKKDQVHHKKTREKVSSYETDLEKGYDNTTISSELDDRGLEDMLHVIAKEENLLVRDNSKEKKMGNKRRNFTIGMFVLMLLVTITIVVAKEKFGLTSL